jgi:hypothetical protein
MIILFAFMPARPAVGDNTVNSLQSQGVFGIVFNQAAVLQQLAVFLVNNDYVNAFDITFHFANVGKFKSGSNEIPMTLIKLNTISGTLGAGLINPATNLTVSLNGSGDWTWDPGTTQTTVTSLLLLELKASWPDASNAMAGFYSETITATISVGL